MKLYELPNKSYFKAILNEEGDLSEPLFLDHLDGAFSYCKTEDERVVHIAVWTEIVPIDNPIKE